MPNSNTNSIKELNVRRIARYVDDFGRGFAQLEDVESGVVVFGSARTPESDRYYQDARRLSAHLAKAGLTIITGGGPGIMEAANRGAFEAGGPSIGLNIRLPMEQASNPYLTKDVTFDYFFVRKISFVRYAKAFVIFPGGFGTMDELFEVLTLIQTDKLDLPPFYIYDSEFWGGLKDWIKEKMLGLGYISKKDLDILHIMDDVDELAATLIKDLGK